MNEKINDTMGKTLKRKQRDVFVYNLMQAQFFLDCGLCPIAVGKGRYGGVFLRFERNEPTERVFQRWNKYAGQMKNKWPS